MLEFLSTVPVDASPYEKVKAAYEFVIITAEYDMESENSQNIRGAYFWMAGPEAADIRRRFSI